MKYFICTLFTLLFYLSSPNIGVAKMDEYFCQCDSYYHNSDGRGEEEGTMPCGIYNQKSLTLFLEHKRENNTSYDQQNGQQQNGEQDWVIKLKPYRYKDLDELNVTGYDNG